MESARSRKRRLSKESTSESALGLASKEKPGEVEGCGEVEYGSTVHVHIGRNSPPPAPDFSSALGLSSHVGGDVEAPVQIDDVIDLSGINGPRAGNSPKRGYRRIPGSINQPDQPSERRRYGRPGGAESGALGRERGAKERSLAGGIDIESFRGGNGNGEKGDSKNLQATLYGKIVRGIQEKDPSTCSEKVKRQRSDSRKVPLGSIILPPSSSKEKGVVKIARGDAVVTDQPNVEKSKIEAADDGVAFADSRLKSLLAKSDQIMKETFRIPSLRSLQPDAIRTALSGKSQIVVMATGGGKSLCYQLPATTLQGVTVVVSPLIALMVDQVDGLNKKGIPSALVSSANGERNNLEVLQRLVGRRDVTGKGAKSVAAADFPLKPLKLVYCTPELVETNRFRAVLSELHQKKKLALFAGK